MLSINQTLKIRAFITFRLGINVKSNTLACVIFLSFCFWLCFLRSIASILFGCSYRCLPLHLFLAGALLPVVPFSFKIFFLFGCTSNSYDAAINFTFFTKEKARAAPARTHTQRKADEEILQAHVVAARNATFAVPSSRASAASHRWTLLLFFTVHSSVPGYRRHQVFQNIIDSASIIIIRCVFEFIIALQFLHDAAVTFSQ